MKLRIYPSGYKKKKARINARQAVRRRRNMARKRGKK